MTCEKCGGSTDRSYGSGRFCSAICARSFSTSVRRAETNEKIRMKLRERANPPVSKECRHCKNEFSVPYNKRARIFCSQECFGAACRKNAPGEHPVVAFRQRLKVRAVEYKGGCCSFCGYRRSYRALQFHHLDPTKKDFGIGGKSLTWEKVRVELDKCVLVCANCHSEIHDGLIPGPEDLTRTAS